MIRITYEYICDVCKAEIRAKETYSWEGASILGAFPAPDGGYIVSGCHVCDRCARCALKHLVASRGKPVT